MSSTFMERRDRGLVYFFDDGEEIKIGWSVAPEIRLKDVQRERGKTLKLLETFAGGMGDENTLHHHFHKLRTQGEWFRKEPALLEFIERVGKHRLHINRGLPLRDFIDGRFLVRGRLNDPLAPQLDEMLAWVKSKRPLVEGDEDLRVVALHTERDIKHAQKGGDAQRIWLKCAAAGMAKLQAATMHIGR